MSNSRSRLALLVAVFIATAIGIASPLHAARVSKVQDTKHNLSATGAGTTKSGSESQICVFCHTPHGADTSSPAPLWNKTFANKTYTVYTSNSLDAEAIRGTSIEQPMGGSKLCLSCHDGAMALGSVRVLRGKLDQTIPVSNTGAGGTMPTGSGVTTGYTRQLGNLGGKVAGQYDLTNDHPISVTYNSALAERDGELRTPDVNQNSTVMIGSTHPLFGKRTTGQTSVNRPVLPLEPTGASGAGQVQCTTCHDPHLKETDLTNEANIKFLRRNRFQLAQPTNAYSDANDIMCLACHDKGMQGAGGTTWASSAHANSLVATQTYRAAAATTRDFPTAIPVWKAACLNCHDTHTVTGSRRLLREGTDANPATVLASGGFRAGGSSALEETCYQCHRAGAESILTDSTSVPNIRDDFQLTYKMPIANTEVHDIGGDRAISDGFAGTGGNSGSDCTTTDNKCGADFIESRAKMGNGVPANRHAECTDCHNPHRVVKNRLFYGSVGGTFNITTPQTEGTHNHLDTASGHTNVASGVLRGSWGVEPIYSDNSFHSRASNFTVRRGDPGNDTVPNTSAPDTKSYVTREYQICLKCHSSYGYGTTPPTTGASIGQNGLIQYTDQAKEFQAPDSHANEPLSVGTSGGAIGYNTNNHRSWHPVMRATGRTAGERDLTANSAFNHPFRDVGTQTMYCSDCHGSSTGGSTVIPTGTNPTTGAGNPWGPHGSTLPFILKGTWDNESGFTSKSGTAATTNHLCLKCHNPLSSSGFNGSKGNLHVYHQDKVQRLECTWCHVAVPHGWKNKALLVNLNDVGEEAGLGVGSSKEVSMNSTDDYYTNPPYYLQAKNKIASFAASGNWEEGNCGSAGKTGTGLTTGRINSTNGETGNTTGTGKNWMLTQVCDGAPP